MATAWVNSTLSTTLSYTGTGSHTYKFRVQATDRAGNLSAWVESNQATVTSVGVRKYYKFGSQVVAERSGSNLYYLNSDHLSSTSLVTSPSGQVVFQARYEPYGQMRWSSGQQTTDRTFTGQRMDASFGLMNYNARYYDPTLGRFISPDMLISEPNNPLSYDHYSYVYNNPLNYTDPTGQSVDNGCKTEGCSTEEGEEYRDYVYNVLYSEEDRLANSAKAEAILTGITEFELGLVSAPALLAFKAINDENISGLDLAFAILPGVGKIAGEGLNSVQVADDTVELVSKANGQWHHVFSTKIMNALNKHELLRGVFKRNDLIVQAADKASHYGYQTWHRVSDNEVVTWLASEKGASASASEFLEYLGSIYGRSDMRNRFPEATNIISTALEVFQ